MADDVLSKRDANRNNNNDRRQLQPSSMAIKYQKGLKELQDSRNIIDNDDQPDRPRSGYRSFKPSQPTKQRILISGKPNSGKSTSLDTFDKQVAIVVAPGEQGTGSFSDRDGVNYFQMQQEPGDQLDTVDVMLAFQDLLYMLIDCKEYTTIAIDGIHKVHECFVNIASNGARFTGVAFDNRIYGLAHDMFKALIGELFYANTPMIVYTCWCDMEFIDQDLSAGQKQDRRVMPYLSGRMAMDIMGLLNTGSVHAMKSSLCEQPGCKYNDKRNKEFKKEHYVWQLEQDLDNNVNGDCGLKLPRHNLEIPKYIHQDWSVLKSIINQVWQHVLSKQTVRR